MEYIELDCTVTPGGENIEILIAFLGAVGYSMFEETEQGVKAYIDKELFSQVNVDTIPLLNDDDVQVTYQVIIPENKNWNEEWEKNFKPVIIGKDIYVRAEYHEPDPSARFELIIHPRMAFGTGHHATTSLVMEHMLDLDLNGKRILDMGCGTGILAILATKMGASTVIAIDNDPNAVENAKVNCEINNASSVNVYKGDGNSAGSDGYDVIIANINRNIILEDLPAYVAVLKTGGLLVTSGYYMSDLPAIKLKASACGLTFKSNSESESWCRATFTK